ncbi:hypothetical protein BDR04DRAFT_1124084 [Suillus decipiens]|nr:hypothetical protein BDR04DRAFT_1124084 [Suillus decipiens]
MLLGSLAVSLAILVPLAGALVRFRAHYNPKGLQLDSEGGVQPHTGPVISSFVSMLRRVYRIEGWPGLYKGLMPTLLSTLVITFFLMIFLSDSNLRHGTYSAPDAGVVGILVYSIFAMLVSLPQVIITNRAITTPHKLPYLNPIYSLRVLLTPTEPPEFNSISQEEEDDAEEATEYAGAEEDVIGLRTDREPYVGLIDCGKRIIEEEGWGALYRAWWLTTLGSLSGAFS